MVLLMLICRLSKDTRDDSCWYGFCDVYDSLIIGKKWFLIQLKGGCYSKLGPVTTYPNYIYSQIIGDNDRN